LAAFGALALAACASAMASRSPPTSAASPQPSALPVLPLDVEATADRDEGAEASAADRPPVDPSQHTWTLPADGTIGAWLVAPATRATPVDRVPPVGDAGGDDSLAAPWKVVLGKAGVLDVAAAVGAGVSAAYAAGALEAERPGRYVLLIGADDAVTVFVDGGKVFARDSARVRRDDEDLVAFDLPAGSHTLVLALRRRGIPGTRPWALRARLLGPELEAPSRWGLAGTSPETAADEAARVARVTLDRRMGDVDYRPELQVRLDEGAPAGARLAVRVRVTRAALGAASDPLVDADLGFVGGPAPADGIWRIPVSTLPAGSIEDDDWTIHTDVGGRSTDFPFHPRRVVREAIGRARRALEGARGAAWLLDVSRESVAYLCDRLASFVGKGDGDLEADVADAREIDELAAAIERGRDPYVGHRAGDAESRNAAEPDGRPPGDEGGAGTAAPNLDTRFWRKGAMRRAYRSPVDGQPSEFAVYVPPDFDPRRTYPLVVALHGMNGYPMEMLMWLFGHDDPQRDAAWEDRHPVRDLDPLPAIVVAPDGHFNAMYRDLGEDDVMRVIDWAVATYPIDPARVSITGPSMGGIGTAACALHHPDRFAAAEPLCGYHSYFVRTDISGRTLRPWERIIAEERSNVFWAENGKNLPLYIVHGTRDLPEENSSVLIDRYEELHYDVEHEHPDLGHNVWQTTYEDLKGAKWLLSHRRPLHPSSVRFKTARARWGDDAWVHVRELAASDAWGEVIARIDDRRSMTVVTHGVGALGLDRDAVLVDDAAPIAVTVDGDRTTFQAGEAIELRREPDPDGGKSHWRGGPVGLPGDRKAGTVTGPIHDVFHEPILFVWGASDPAQARANEEVARAWAHVRWGVRVGYPIESDTEFYARGEAIANDRALFLVGNARSNRVVRELEQALPIRIDGGDVVVGANRISATDGDADRSQLGAIFIRPNPRRHDRYVVVVEGVGPLGTWRSLSLPDMLPDFAVYDDGVTAARNGLTLGGATLRAGGFFGQDWSVLP
jgi:poly(3-hydroxybutyrate) depolymerase